MKKWLLIVSIGCISCSSTTLQPMRPALLSTAQGEVNEDILLWPERSVSELLTLRLRLCAEKPAVRTEIVEKLKNGYRFIDEHSVDENKLDTLLLASCEPALTPGVLNQLLAQLTAAGTWPEEYAAFFDLLIAGQKAYAAVEKVYFDLAKDHAALQKEHEQAILGLGEIETQIEEQNK